MTTQGLGIEEFGRCPIPDVGSDVDVRAVETPEQVVERILADTEFVEVEPFRGVNDRYLVTDAGGNKGLTDETGKLVIACEYRGIERLVSRYYADFRGQKVPVYREHEYEATDNEGQGVHVTEAAYARRVEIENYRRGIAEKLANATKYVSVEPLSNGFFLVTDNEGKKGIVDKDGTVGVKCKNDEVKCLDDSKNIYLVRRGNKWGVLECKYCLIGEPWIVKCKYDSIKYTGRFIVEKDGQFGLIHGDGKVSFRCEFDSIEGLNFDGAFRYLVRKGDEHELFDVYRDERVNHFSGDYESCELAWNNNVIATKGNGDVILFYRDGRSESDNSGVPYTSIVPSAWNKYMVRDKMGNVGVLVVSEGRVSTIVPVDNGEVVDNSDKGYYEAKNGEGISVYAVNKRRRLFEVGEGKDYCGYEFVPWYRQDFSNRRTVDLEGSLFVVERPNTLSEKAVGERSNVDVKGAIDLTGELVMPVHYESIERLNEYDYMVKRGGRFGIRRPKKSHDTYMPQDHIPCIYDTIKPSNLLKKASYEVSIDGEFGLIDYWGKDIVEVGRYDQFRVVNGMILGRKDEKWGCTSIYGDSVGVELVPCGYDEAKTLDASYIVLERNVGDEGRGDRVLVSFTGGVIPLSSGDELSHVTVREATEYKGVIDYISIENGGKFGAIVDFGKRLIECKYDKCEAVVYKPDSAHSPINGFRVELDGKVGMYSKEGVQIVPCEYDDIEVCSFGHELIYLVKKGGQCGAFDELGKELLPCEYDEIEARWVGTEFTRVKKNGKYGLFDKGMRVVSECIYDELVLGDSYVRGDGPLSAYVFGRNGRIWHTISWELSSKGDELNGKVGMALKPYFRRRNVNVSKHGHALSVSPLRVGLWLTLLATLAATAGTETGRKGVLDAGRAFVGVMDGFVGGDLDEGGNAAEGEKQSVDLASEKAEGEMLKYSPESLKLFSEIRLTSLQEGVDKGYLVINSEGKRIPAKGLDWKDGSSIDANNPDTWVLVKIYGAPATFEGQTLTPDMDADDLPYDMAKVMPYTTIGIRDLAKAKANGYIVNDKPAKGLDWLFNNPNGNNFGSLTLVRLP